MHGFGQWQSTNFHAISTMNALIIVLTLCERAHKNSVNFCNPTNVNLIVSRLHFRTILHSISDAALQLHILSLLHFCFFLPTFYDTRKARAQFACSLNNLYACKYSLDFFF